MEKTSRNYKIDILRVIAIILVVFGHSIILYSKDWGLYHSIYEVPVLDYLKRIINVVQMPLFFMLSGYLLNKEVKNKITLFLFKKTCRLLIPYILVGFFWLLPIRYLVGYSGYRGTFFLKRYFTDIILARNNGHLWFLISLFI